MKVSQQSMFRPVMIELETSEELAALHVALAFDEFRLVRVRPASAKFIGELRKELEKYA